MNPDFGFSLLFGAFCFVVGLVMRGALTQRRIDGHYARGKADGYYEAIMIMEEVEGPKGHKVSHRFEPLKRVK